MPNGHSEHGENGNSGYESPRQESPGASATPKVEAKEPENQGAADTPKKSPEQDSPRPSETPKKADVTIENGEKEADTSKESFDDGRKC